jgi:DeoR/GlpR family transcriptional regulator of sugar metabolism
MCAMGSVRSGWPFVLTRPVGAQPSVRAHTAGRSQAGLNDAVAILRFSDIDLSQAEASCVRQVEASSNDGCLSDQYMRDERTFLHVYILVYARYASRMNEDIPLGRREIIALRLAKGDAVVASDLAHEFGVSEDAIRRDLRALAAEGRCRRVYGGALPIAPNAPPMAARLDEARERKHALAQRAISLIKKGEFLFLDSGSTNLALVDLLPEDWNLTIATNSIDIAAAVLRRTDLHLVLVGGEVDVAIGGCVDANAVLKVSELNIDRSFVGACAVTIASGASAFLPADAAFKRALIAASTHSTLLVLSEKLSARAPYRVATLDAFDHIVLESTVPVAERKRIAGAGPVVLLTEPS